MPGYISETDYMQNIISKLCASTEEAKIFQCLIILRKILHGNSLMRKEAIEAGFLKMIFTLLTNLPPNDKVLRHL